MTQQQTIEQAIEFLENGNFVYPTELRTNLRALLEDMKKQEPVLSVSADDLSFMKRPDDWIRARLPNYAEVNLYTHPPLPQREGWQLKLPQRLPEPRYDADFQEGWNACLDEIEAINAAPKPTEDE